jgi:hypothetical protein
VPISISVYFNYSIFTFIVQSLSIVHSHPSRRARQRSTSGWASLVPRPGLGLVPAPEAPIGEVEALAGLVEAKFGDLVAGVLEVLGGQARVTRPDLHPDPVGGRRATVEAEGLGPRVDLVGADLPLLCEGAVAFRPVCE